MTSITQTAKVDINNDGNVDTITFTLSEVGKNVRTLHASADLGNGQIRDLGTASVPPQGAYNALSFTGDHSVTVKPEGAAPFTDTAQGIYSVDVDPETGVTVHFNGTRSAWLNGAGDETEFYPDCSKFGYHQKKVDVAVPVAVN